MNQNQENVQETYKVAYLRLEVEIARSEGKGVTFADKNQFSIFMFRKIERVCAFVATCEGVECWGIKILNPEENPIAPIEKAFRIIKISDEEMANASLEEAAELDKSRMNLVEAREHARRAMERDEEEREKERAANEKWKREMAELLGDMQQKIDAM